MRSRYAFIALVVLFLSAHVHAQVQYAAAPSGFSPGNQIKLMIDTVNRMAIVKKIDDGPFWKSGSMQLLQNGVSLAWKNYAQNDPSVVIPFSWNFTSGSRTYSAIAWSSDGNKYQSGNVVVTATTIAPPTFTFTGGAVWPGSGEQTTSQFTWDVWAKSSNGQSFPVTLWIVQPNGVPVSFGMTPVSPNWSTNVRFTLPKNLLSFGAYGFYFTTGTTRYPQYGTFYGPVTTPYVRKQMSSTTYHAGVHLFGNDPATIRKQLQLIRDTITSKATTACFSGNGKQVQLQVQFDFRFADYPDREQTFLSQLDQAVDAALSEGFAVHLLLSMHDRPANTHWRGYDFTQTWAGSSHPFTPYQPAKTRGSGPAACVYDIIAENFTTEVLKHLVDTRRAEKLAVVYVANELDYRTPLKASENWPGCGTTTIERTECRNAALAYTAQRILGIARNAAAGKVKVGLKFASVSDPNSAFLKPSSTKLGDQLSYLLTVIMSPMGDVVGFDAYFNDANLYDKTNYYRLQPFLPSFANGRLEIAEYGRICKGAPSQFTLGARTKPADMSGLANWWWSSRSFNLFAFNASGPDAGCYAVYTNGNWAQNGGLDGKSELAGVWNQITAITGPNPQPCSY